MLNLFIPKQQTTLTSVAFLILRVVVGLAFILHGYGKIQNPMAWMGPDSPIPGIFQFLAAFSEFAGGIALIIGLLTPLASLGMASTMVVATAFHALVQKDPFVSKGGPSYELALVYLCILLVIIAVGPGKLSLDAKIFRKK